MLVYIRDGTFSSILRNDLIVYNKDKEVVLKTICGEFCKRELDLKDMCIYGSLLGTIKVC